MRKQYLGAPSSQIYSVRASLRSMAVPGLLSHFYPPIPGVSLQVRSFRPWRNSGSANYQVCDIRQVASDNYILFPHQWH
jgi:hypothetical protein